MPKCGSTYSEHRAKTFRETLMRFDESPLGKFDWTLHAARSKTNYWRRVGDCSALANANVLALHPSLRSAAGRPHGRRFARYACSTKPLRGSHPESERQAETTHSFKLLAEGRGFEPRLGY
jgi:hypothetical protein